MWIWQELQLAPTHDALAIKRAYAKRLKVTRPDDDAAAYQRLREAYDHAMAWAKRAGAAAPAAGTHVAPEALAAVEGPAVGAATHLPAVADDAPPAATDDGFGESHGADADASSTDPLPDTDDGFAEAGGAVHAQPVRPLDDGDGADADTDAAPPWESPEGIARSVYGYWQTHGDDALLAIWPRVRQDLDAVPFALRDEASAWMANLVLDHPALPPAFVELLAERFQWGLDFRVTQALGSERAFLLSQRLRELGVLRNNDPSVLRRYAEVLRLRDLREAGRRTRAAILALLLPEHVLERWLRTPQRLRAGFGIPPEAADDIAQWLGRAAVVRMLVGMAVLAALVGSVSGAHGTREAMLASVTVFAALGAWVGALLLQRALDRLQAWLARRFAFLVPAPGNWRLAGALFAATVSAAVPWVGERSGVGVAMLAAWSMLVLGALLAAWSRVHASSAMLVPVAAAIAVALHALFPDATPVSSTVSLALAWTLACHWLLVRRPMQVLQFYRSPLTYFRPAHAWGWVLWIVFFKGVVAFAAAMTVLSLPLTLIVQSIGYGQRFAFGTILLGFAVAYALAGGEGLVEMFPLLGLLLAAIAMAVLQATANALARMRALR